MRQTPKLSLAVVVTLIQFCSFADNPIGPGCSDKTNPGVGNTGPGTTPLDCGLSGPEEMCPGVLATYTAGGGSDCDDEQLANSACAPYSCTGTSKPYCIKKWVNTDTVFNWSLNGDASFSGPPRGTYNSIRDVQSNTTLLGSFTVTVSRTEASHFDDTNDIANAEILVILDIPTLSEYTMARHQATTMSYGTAYSAFKAGTEDVFLKDGDGAGTADIFCCRGAMLIDGEHTWSTAGEYLYTEFNHSSIDALSWNVKYVTEILWCNGDGDFYGCAPQGWNQNKMVIATQWTDAESDTFYLGSEHKVVAMHEYGHTKGSLDHSAVTLNFMKGGGDSSYVHCTSAQCGTLDGAP